MHSRILARTFALCASFCVTLSAYAEQLVYTDTVPLTITNWNRTMTIPKFDPALGTLISVEVGFTGGVIGTTRYENTDNKGTTITEELSAIVTVFKPDLSTILQVTPAYQGVYQVPAFDGTIDFAGPSGATHAGVNAEESDAMGPYSVDNAFYTGVGTITFPVTATATSYVSGAGNLVSGFNTNAYASMFVKYNYDSIPQCVPAQDGVSYENLTCGASTTTIQLDGSASVDAKSKGLQFIWGSNCPNASFSDATAVAPTLTFDSLANGQPTSCTVTLIVTDSFGQQASCQTAVSVGGCTFDCLGELNGPARPDNCGVCNGSNSCYDCNDFDTLSSRFQLDGTSLAQLKNLKKAVKFRRNVTGDPKFGETLVATGTAFYTEAWTLAWSLPEFITTCANVQFCQAVNNQAFEGQYLNNSDGLKSLTFSALQGLKPKNASEKKRIKFYKKKATDLAKQNAELLSSIPNESQCVGSGS